MEARTNKNIQLIYKAWKAPECYLSIYISVKIYRVNITSDINESVGHGDKRDIVFYYNEQIFLAMTKRYYTFH